MFSLIIPFYNEEKNVTLLYEEIISVLKKEKESYEIIFVNDGSTDNGALELKKIKDSHVKLFEFARRKGKGAALARGIKEAEGSIVIFMDADLQDDPRDIPLLLKKVQEGYDVVNGIRSNRKDNLLIKLYSKTLNIFLRKFVHSPFTDINCGFKAIHAEVFHEVFIYANQFRFVPLAAYLKGFKTTEVPVHNRPRKFGSSKFGAGKIMIGFFDYLTGYFIYTFSERPLHFFGPWGSVFLGIGGILTIYLLIERIFFHHMLYRRPALLIGIMCVIVGLQVIMTGILGELIVYLHKQHQKNF